MAYKITKIDSSRDVPDGKATYQDLENLRNEISDISPDFYQMEVAEVIEIHLHEKYMPQIGTIEGETEPEWSKYGAIIARMTISAMGDASMVEAYPLEANIKEYPLPGELVIIVEYTGKMFYTQKLNLFNSISRNSFSGYSANKQKTISHYTPGIFKRDDNIREVQSQQGDITFNGRFGQSIRFGSNITKEFNPAGPIEGTGLRNSPNILIKAGQSHPMSGSSDRADWTKFEYNDYRRRPVMEDLNEDGSSIWITTNQGTNLNYSGAPLKDYVHDELDKGEFKDVKKLGGNQIILNSDRISFNTKKNSVLINSTRNIALSAAYDIGLEVAPPHGKIKLGTMDANQPVLGGNQTMVLISDLCDIVDKFATSLIAAVGGYISPVALTQLNTAAGGLSLSLNTFKTRLDSAKSKTVFVGHLRG
jgi:hypothetical protein